MKEIVVIALCLLRSVEPVIAQITHEKIELVLGSKQQTDTHGFSRWQELNYQYERTMDSSLWMHIPAKQSRALIVQLLHRAEDLGLNEKDYQYDFIRSFSEQTFSLCDNAPGLIKLDFDNPGGVYLHDTPDKSLFGSGRHYFSHGCIRMEKPMELGHLILRNNSIAIDTLEAKRCLRNQAPVTVEADEKMPVGVWYNPVDVNETGGWFFVRMPANNSQIKPRGVEQSISLNES